MGKKPQLRKYGAPLYCAAWPSGQFVYVAGGGGKKSSGIANRIIVSQQLAGDLTDEVTDLQTGDDAPLRMAATSSGKEHVDLVVAMGSGGVQLVYVDTSDKIPQLSLATGSLAAKLHGVGLIKCLTFSRDGRLLALGGEDGSVCVLEWPGLKTRIELRDNKGLSDAVRDADFSSAHNNKVLATTCEDGTGILWDWERGQQIATLELPTGMERGSFNRVRFARDGSLSLYTAVNAAGNGYMLHWEQDNQGELVLRRKIKAHNSAITAFEISSRGRYLATGTSEGEIEVFSTQTLTSVRRVNNAHMVFVTAITFSPNEDFLLSVSADASARCTAIDKPSAVKALLRSPKLWLLIFSIVVVLLAYAWQHMQMLWQEHKAEVQQLIDNLQDPYDAAVAS